jgi:hypothetical protein
MILRAAVLRYFLVAMSLPAIALAAPGDAPFAKGVAAFKSESYSAALDYFRQALAAGLDSPSLHYNLGVSLYKLGRYDEAEAAFRACARDPAWAPLAYYNIGLTAYQRGAHAVAREYFEDAWRTADSDEVRTLASAMLERLSARIGYTRAILTADIGHNDNVTLAADNQTLQTTRESDFFAELLAAATGRWGGVSDAPRWDASLYNISHERLTDNNITELLVGAAKPGSLREWRVEAGGLWQYVLRNGERFQQIGSLRLEGSQEWSNRRDVRVALLLSRVDALDGDFEFLAGSRQELDVSTAQPAGRGLIRAGITLERNDRQDLTFTDEFYSYSPARQGLRLEGSWSVTTNWRFDPSARYYESRYADPDRRTDGVTATREDEYLELSLRARRRLTLPWQLVAEYTYVRNTSNFSEFSYTQRLILIGISRPL